MNFLSREIITKVLSQAENDASNILIRGYEVDNKIISTGANYSSEITRLTIHYEKNGNLHSQKYIYKLPSNALLYEFGVKSGSYEKECIMYSHVLPELLQYNENIAPLHFYTGDKHSLILEDLSQSGYTQPKKHHLLDFHHCRLVFISLARFHAFSVHLNKRDKIPDSCKDHGVFEKFIREAELHHFMNNAWNVFSDRLPEPYKERYSPKLRKMQSTFIDDLLNAVQPTKNGFNCLNHGDFWLTNILFKYNEYGVVERLKFIDFQCSNWSSPVIDILRFITSSMRFEVYEKYFDLLLDVYLDTLNKILTYFQYDTYKQEDLKKDIEDRFIYVIISVVTFLPLVLTDFEDDGIKDIDASKVFTNTDGSKKFLEKMADNEYIMEIQMKWFKHFVDRGLLDD